MLAVTLPFATPGLAGFYRGTKAFLRSDRPHDIDPHSGVVGRLARSVVYRQVRLPRDSWVIVFGDTQEVLVLLEERTEVFEYGVGARSVIRFLSMQWGFAGVTTPIWFLPLVLCSSLVARRKPHPIEILTEHPDGCFRVEPNGGLRPLSGLDLEVGLSWGRHARRTVERLSSGRS